jgi:hypothetical protein
LAQSQAVAGMLLHQILAPNGHTIFGKARGFIFYFYLRSRSCKNANDNSFRLLCRKDFAIINTS